MIIEKQNSPFNSGKEILSPVLSGQYVYNHEVLV